MHGKSYENEPSVVLLSQPTTTNPEEEPLPLYNLKSFSVDVRTGERHFGATLARRSPDDYVHVLVPSHEVRRFLPEALADHRVPA